MIEVKQIIHIKSKKSSKIKPRVKLSRTCYRINITCKLKGDKVVAAAGSNVAANIPWQGQM